MEYMADLIVGLYGWEDIEDFYWDWSEPFTYNLLVCVNGAVEIIAWGGGWWGSGPYFNFNTLDYLAGHPIPGTHFLF
jgi:hypothetical protein